MKWLKSIILNNQYNIIKLIDIKKLKKWKIFKLKSKEKKLLEEKFIIDFIVNIRKYFKLDRVEVSDELILFETINIVRRIISENSFKFYLYDTLFTNDLLWLCITLLRVGWITNYEQDKFITYKAEIYKNNKLTKKKLKEILLDKEVLTSIINFIRCNNKLNPVPLIANNINSNEEFLSHIEQYQISNNNKRFLLNAYNFNDSKKWFINSIRLLHNLFFVIEELRKRIFYKYSNIYKIQSYNVLEILKNNNGELYGFNVHFSNWNIATYTREEKGTMAVNIRLDTKWLWFNIWFIDNLTNIYMYNNKPLYEIWINSRYNDYWTWKPLIWATSDEFQRKAESISKEERIKWIAFYAICSCTYNIEFVIKTKIKLEEKFTTISNWISFYLCDMWDDENNEYIYDCNITFDSLDEESILKKLSIIEKTISNMTFIYEEKIDWELKYKMINHERWSVNTNLKELDLFWDINNISNDIINSSIHWYNHAIKSDELFNKFLSFAISIEKLCSWLYENFDNFDLPIHLEKESDDDKKERLNNLKNSLFVDENKIIDDIDILSKADWWIHSNMKIIFKLIFWEDSKLYKIMFDRYDGDNIYWLRSKIAHWHVYKDEKKYIRKIQSRIYDINIIAKSLLGRVIQKKLPNEKLEDFFINNTKSISFNTTNPKMTLITSDLSHFPETDWKIKREWLD